MNNSATGDNIADTSMYDFNIVCGYCKYHNNAVDKIMAKIMFRVMMAVLMSIYYYFPYVLLPCTNQLNFAVISSNKTLH